MAYNDSQTLNFLTKMEKLQLKLSDFSEEWETLNDEWTRNGVATGVTQELLDNSKYAGTTVATVTTSVSASAEMLTTLEAGVSYEAWLQQIQLFCKNR